jgi:hypothetical protein
MTKRFNQRLGSVVSAGRTREEVARFFAGLDLVEPGIVPTPQWRPAAPQFGRADGQGEDPSYAALGRKP